MILIHIQIQPEIGNPTYFYNNDHTDTIISDPDLISDYFKENFKHIHPIIISQYPSLKKNNKITNNTPYNIYLLKRNIITSHAYKVTQIRTNKSLLWQNY